MRRYTYRAKDIYSNRTINGEGDFGSDYEVKQYLATMQLLPLRVKEKSNEIINLTHFIGTHRKIGQRELAFLCRQLGTLIQSGINISMALELLAEECEHIFLKTKLMNIYRHIQEGENLAEAIRRQQAFPALLIAMVENGEASGKLEEVFIQLADYFEGQMEVSGKLKKALTYPISLMVIVVGALIIISLGVIPAFVGLFEEAGVTLPYMTQLIIKGSEWFGKYWEIIVISSGVLFFLIRILLQKPILKKYFEYFIFHLPLIGKFKKKIIAVRFSECMAMLIEAGVPILTALENSKSVVGSLVVEELLDVAIQRITQGENLEQAIRRSSIFSSIMMGMIRIGEETGTLDQMFVKIGVYLKLEVKQATEHMIGLIEPLFTIVIAMIICIIMLAVVTPTFTLATELM